MAATTNIPREQWSQFLDQFSRQHQGWRASIEIEDPERGPQHVAEDAPFQGISFDDRGSESGSLEVAVGDQPDRFVSHLIEQPRALRVLEERPGEQAAIQIESKDAPVTLVMLRMAGQLPH